jgi:hypothetical protein
MPTSILLRISIVLLLLCNNGTLGRLSRQSQDDTISRKLVLVQREAAVTNQFIVRFKDDDTMSDADVDQRATELTDMVGGTVLQIYKAVYKGFAFSLPDGNTNIDVILAEADVEEVEQVTSSSVILYIARVHFNSFCCNSSLFSGLPHNI